MNRRQRSKFEHAVHKILRKEYAPKGDMERRGREHQQTTAEAEQKTKGEPNEPATGAQRSVKKDQRQIEQPKSSKRFWRDYEPIEKFNFVIAISTTIYMATTLFIYQQSRQSFIDGNRAYIVIKDALLFGPDPNNPKGIQPIPRTLGDLPHPIGQVDFINSGNTPAKETFTKFWFELRPDIIKPNCAAWVDPTQVSKSVVPKDGHIFASRRLQRTIGTSELREIANEKLSLVIYGCVAYLDIFDRPHKTVFCMLFDKNTGVMARCGKYNEID
jgi:hypothetical protein